MSQELRDWLGALQLEHLAPVFAEHQVTLQDIPLLSDLDLQEIGISLGPRRRILHAGKALQLPSATEPMRSGSESNPFVPTAERRQLTVMFCDLVGSTALSTRFDPEVMRDIVGAYQSAVTSEVNRLGGHVAKLMGDGVLCYFGYPTAHEDEAERAVRSGLAIIEAVSKCPTPTDETLKARIGISTGLVVVGDLVGEGAAQEQAVIGEAPNLAARIESLAAPGQVLISRTTRELLGQKFDLEDLGSHAFKGFDELERVFEVRGEREFAGSSESFVSAHPMVGRDQELSLLLDRWELAKAGEGQGAVVVGEAGIGKSRLVTELQIAAATDDHRLVRLQCSPYHSDSSLWPAIHYIKQLAGIARSDSPNEQLDKLRAVLASAQTRSSDSSQEFLARLLGFDALLDQTSDLAPKELRARIFQELVRLILCDADKTPLLLIVEDAHWIDPTTIELIEQFLDEIDRLPVLLLLTTRPTDEALLKNRTRMLRLTLSQLNRDALQQLVEKLIGTVIAEGAVADIVKRSDGIPLFAEELAKSFLGQKDTRVPASLHDSLVSRLDRIPEARKVAQLAACIGREFDFQLLSEATDQPQAEIREALDQLCSVGVLLNRRDSGDGGFIFSHALVRDVAYQSTLRSERSGYHLRIAKALALDWASIDQTEPAVVALHFERAGELSDAAHYWFIACQQSVSRSADREAIALAENALRCLQLTEPSKARSEQELRVLMSYGVALLSVKGWASPQTVEVFERAQTIAEEVGDEEQQFAATWNVWLYKQQSGQVREAQELVENVLSQAGHIDDDEVKVEAHHAAWTTGFGSAPLLDLRNHVEQGLARYDVDRHRLCWSRYGGHDAGVCGHGHGAWVAWFEGRSDAAQEHIRRGEIIASTIDHAYSNLVYLFYACSMDVYRREPSKLLQRSEFTLALADELGLAQHAAIVRVFRGWALVHLGTRDDGLNELKAGLNKLDQLKVQHRMTFYLAVLADACLEAGQSQHGNAAIQRALSLIEPLCETRWHSELRRLQANLALITGVTDRSEVLNQLRESIAIAENDGSRPFELRSRIDLARLLAEQGDRSQALELLRYHLDFSAESQKTPEQVDALTLMRELA